MTHPTLLLLPGLDGSAELFEWFIKQLPTGLPCKTVAYPIDTPADLDAFAQVVEAAAVDQTPVVVIAESFSGPVALRLLARSRLNIAAIVLVASFARSPNPLLQLGRVLPISAIAPFVHSESVLKAMCVGWNAEAAVVRQLQRVLEALPLATIKARLDLLRKVNESKTLALAATPILYLRAMRDRLVTGSCSRDLVNAPDCRTVEVDGPHFLLQSRPAECWELIATWLRGVQLT